MSTTLSAPQRFPAPADESCADWKQQLTERLGAYRVKHPEAASPTCPNYRAPGDSRASEIARSVASRYASAPTYDELLRAAAEAERAAAEAQAALAERIASDARAQRELELSNPENDVRQFSADSQETVPAGGDQPRELRTPAPDASENPDASDNVVPARSETVDAPAQTIAGTPVMPRFAARSREMHLHQQAFEPEPSLEDLWTSALVEPRAFLPSKLIEFPRELVSSRRAKLPPPAIPGDRSLASVVSQPETSQLRIFEVEAPPPEIATGTDSDDIVGDPTHVARFEGSAGELAGGDGIEYAQGGAVPEVGRESATHPRPIKFENPALAGATRPTGRSASGLRRPEPPGTSIRTGTYAGSFPVGRVFRGLEWAAISLDEDPAASAKRAETMPADANSFLVDRASIQRRIMAFAVDFCVVTAGFFAFLLIFAASTTHIPTGTTALLLGGTVYGCLWLLYQLLSFSLGGATAGMLYARIALCTFDDRNPTRVALRHRLAAWWLAVLPVGIGFLWCFVDEDNLGWHDRITRTYQREY